MESKDLEKMTKQELIDLNKALTAKAEYYKSSTVVLMNMRGRLTQQPPEFEDYDGYADGQPVYDTWKCPNCHSEYDIEEKHNYCPNCGQAIDWSDDNG